MLNVLIKDSESAAGSLTVEVLEADSTGRDGETVGLGGAALSTDAIVRICVLKAGRAAANIARALRALVRREAIIEEWSWNIRINWIR